MVKVGYDVRQAPFCLKDKNGQVIGIDVDYLQLISERTGLRFEGVNDRTDWLEIFRTTPVPPVDFITNLGYIPERKLFLSYTRPYCTSPIVIVTRDDAPDMVRPADLKGRRVGIVEGFEAEAVALKQSPTDCVIVEYHDDLGLLKAVAAGEC